MATSSSRDALAELPFHDIFQKAHDQQLTKTTSSSLLDYRIFLEVSSPDTMKKVSWVFPQAMPKEHVHEGLRRPVVIIPIEELEEACQVLEGICSYQMIGTKEGATKIKLQLDLGYEDLLCTRSLEKLLGPYQFVLEEIPPPKESAKLLYSEAKQYYLQEHKTEKSLSSLHHITWKTALKKAAQSEDIEERFLTRTPLFSIPPNGDLLRVEQQMLSLLLQDSPGFCIGECHPLYSPKLFLLDHMAHLKELGVKTLFLEPLLYDSCFDMLQSYNQSPPNTPLPAVIARYLSNIDRGEGMHERVGYRAVIEAAHNAGINLIPIDTYRARASCKKGAERSVNMNYEALEIIKRHADPASGKYIIWVGLAHATTPIADEMGSRYNAGLAVSTLTPIIELSDSISYEGLSHISMHNIEETNLSHIMIQRDLYHERHTFSKSEAEALDLLLSLKDTPLPTKEIKKQLKRVLSELQKNRESHPHLLHRIRQIYFNLLNQQHWSYSSHQPSYDFVDKRLAKALCTELEENNPNLTFHRKNISSYLTGGTCSAMAMLFASHFFFVSQNEIFSTDKELFTYVIDHLGDDLELLSIQSALNTVGYKEAAKAQHLDKLASITSLFGFRAQPMGEFMALSDDDCYAAFLDHYQSLNHDGVYFIRCIDPSDNSKGENHGHSTLLIRKAGTTFFYDPNYGVKKFDAQKGLKSLFNDLIQSHLSFRIPLMRIYQITPDEDSALFLPDALINYRKAKITKGKQDIHQLPKDIQHVVLASTDETLEFIRHGFSLHELKDLPSRIAIEVIKAPRLFRYLLDAGYSKEFLTSDTLGIAERVIMLRSAKNLYEAKLIEMQRKISFCRFVGHAMPHSTAGNFLQYGIARSLGFHEPLLAIEEGDMGPKEGKVHRLQHDLSITPLSEPSTIEDAGTLAHAFRTLTFALETIHEEQAGVEHLQNIEDDALENIVLQLKSTYGQENIEPILKLKQEEGFLQRLAMMPKPLAHAVLAFAKARSESSLIREDQSVSWISMLKEVGIEELMQKVNDPSYFESILSLRNKGITLQQLLSLSPSLLHGLLKATKENPYIFWNIKNTWERCFADQHNFNILLSRVGSCHFINIYQLALSEKCSLDQIEKLGRHGSMAAILAAGHITATSLPWQDLLLDHHVMHWLEGGMEKLFADILNLLETKTTSLADLKRFSLLFPQRLYSVLGCSYKIRNAVNTHNFNWQEFFQDPIFEDHNIKIGPWSISYKIQHLRESESKTLHFPLEELFYLAHRHIPLKSLLTMPEDVKVAISESLPRICSILKENKDIDFLRFAQGPFISSVLYSPFNDDMFIDFKTIAPAMFVGCMHLFSAGIHELPSQEQYPLIYYGALSNGQLVSNLIKDKKLHWKTFINDPQLPSVLNLLIEEHKGTLSECHRARCHEIFGKLLQLSSFGLSPSHLAELQKRYPDVRLKDPVECGETLTKIAFQEKQWGALFSDRSVQYLLDKSMHPYIEGILSLYLHNIPLDRIANLLPEKMIKSILASAKDIVSLQGKDAADWIKYAEEPGCQRVIEKIDEKQFASFLKLRLVGFTLNDLWISPFLPELIQLADAIYHVANTKVEFKAVDKTKAHTVSTQQQAVWPEQKKKIVPIELFDDGAIKDDVNTAIDWLLHLKEILQSSSPKKALELLARSKDPTQTLQLLTYNPELFRFVMSLPQDTAQKLVNEPFLRHIPKDCNLPLLHELLQNYKARNHLSTLFTHILRDGQTSDLDLQWYIKKALETPNPQKALELLAKSKDPSQTLQLLTYNPELFRFVMSLPQDTAQKLVNEPFLRHIPKDFDLTPLHELLEDDTTRNHLNTLFTHIMTDGQTSDWDLQLYLKKALETPDPKKALELLATSRNPIQALQLLTYNEALFEIVMSLPLYTAQNLVNEPFLRHIPKDCDLTPLYEVLEDYTTRNHLSTLFTHIMTDGQTSDWDVQLYLKKALETPNPQKALELLATSRDPIQALQLLIDNEALFEIVMSLPLYTAQNLVNEPFLRHIPKDCDLTPLYEVLEDYTTRNHLSTLFTHILRDGQTSDLDLQLYIKKALETPTPQKALELLATSRDPIQALQLLTYNEALFRFVMSLPLNKALDLINEPFLRHIPKDYDPSPLLNTLFKSDDFARSFIQAAARLSRESGSFVTTFLDNLPLLIRGEDKTALLHCIANATDPLHTLDLLTKNPKLANLLLTRSQGEALKIVNLEYIDLLKNYDSLDEFFSLGMMSLNFFEKRLKETCKKIDLLVSGEAAADEPALSVKEYIGKWSEKLSISRENLTSDLEDVLSSGNPVSAYFTSTAPRSIKALSELLAITFMYKEMQSKLFLPRDVNLLASSLPLAKAIVLQKNELEPNFWLKQSYLPFLINHIDIIKLNKDNFYYSLGYILDKIKEIDQIINKVTGNESTYFKEDNSDLSVITDSWAERLGINNEIFHQAFFLALTPASKGGDISVCIDLMKGRGGKLFEDTLLDLSLYLDWYEQILKSENTHKEVYLQKLPILFKGISIHKYVKNIQELLNIPYDLIQLSIKSNRYFAAIFLAARAPSLSKDLIKIAKYDEEYPHVLEHVYEFLPHVEDAFKRKKAEPEKIITFAKECTDCSTPSWKVLKQMNIIETIKGPDSILDSYFYDLEFKNALAELLEKCKEISTLMKAYEANPFLLKNLLRIHQETAQSLINGKHIELFINRPDLLKAFTSPTMADQFNKEMDKFIASAGTITQAEIDETILEAVVRLLKQRKF